MISVHAISSYHTQKKDISTSEVHHMTSQVEWNVTPLQCCSPVVDLWK